MIFNSLHYKVIEGWENTYDISGNTINDAI
jgi:hypothetical protein